MFEHALVTGGSGFVGAHLLSLLKTDFLQLSVSVGSRSARNGISPAGPNLYVTLDLCKSMELHISPDIVLHLAGEKRNEARMWDVNVGGTRKLVDWSARHGVKRFVYLGSVGVYGARKNAGIIDENAPRNPQNTYEASKNAAENWVKENCPRYGMEYLILQPSNVIGWAGGKDYPLLGMMRAIKRGLLAYFNEGDTWFNYVAVEDVAAGLAAAVESHAVNRTFILNSPIQMKPAVDWIADAVGVARPYRRLPATLGFVAGEIASTFTRFTGISLPFSRERFNELTNKTRYDGSAIAEATGFRYPLGIETAMRQLARRYVREGLL